MAQQLKTTLYLEADSYRRLQFVAREMGTTAAELVRRAVTQFLDRQPTRKLPRSLGAGRSKSGKLSERAEALLGGMGEPRDRR